MLVDNTFGSYGCVVVFSAFFIQVIAFGTAQSIGLYNVEFMESFNTSALEVSFVGSINLGLFLGAGPFASVLLSYLSHRQVALIGATMSNVGLLFMPFAPSIKYMYACYGFVTGLGYALVYIPSHILCGLYFTKHESLSTGFASAGLGFGHAVFPILINSLIHQYSWRGSFFIVSAINLQLFVFAVMLRPLERNTVKMNYSEIEGEIEYSRVPLQGSGNGTTSKSNSREPSVSVYQRICLHVRPLANFNFLIYCINNIFWNAGVVIIYIFLSEYVISIGLTKDDAATVLTLLGVGTFLGSILGGLLGNGKSVKRYMLYIFGNIGSGLVSYVFVLPMLHSREGQFITVTLFGCVFGITYGLLVALTVDIVGSSSLGDGFGCLLLTNGIGMFCGPPLAGAAIDSFGSVTPGIYIASGLLMMAGLIMCIVPIRRHCVNKTKTILDQQLNGRCTMLVR